MVARGLVTPVLRNADNMGLAEIESVIRDFGEKAKDGKLTIDDMKGGTFTISNGGVYGSLLSTPILNPLRVLYLVAIKYKKGQWLLMVKLRLCQ